jgi:hypothetical protein
VEEREHVFSVVASWNSWLRQEQARVSDNLNLRLTRPSANCLRSIVVEDALNDSTAERRAPPAFFYCSRNTAEPSRSDPKPILASLARQLSNVEPEQPLLQPAIQIYKRKEAQGFASGPLTITESCDLVVQLSEYSRQTTIILDALDECNPEKRADLLDALEMILKDSKNIVKIFISSRNDQDIVFHLKHYPNLEISSDRNGDDIVNFVNAETKRLIQKGKLLKYSTSRKEMEDLIIRQVIEGASGM